MALSGGPQAVEAAVAATLTAHLKTTLDALWTAAGDVATCPKPYGSSISILTGFAMLEPDPPELVVYTRQGRVGADASGATNAWGQWAHSVVVEMLLAGDDSATLDKQTKRFVWGVAKTLAEHPYLDESLTGGACTVTGYDIHPPDGMQQEAMLALVVTLDETM